METAAHDSVLRFMTCGSVDDGKSTLIGHLLYHTGGLFEDQYQTLVEESKRIGNAGDHLDFSLLLDGLMAERDQGITIDVAYRYFSSKQRKFIVADSPGHDEYTRNMAVAASNSSAAIILVDARLGVLEQTRRHSLICALCGIDQICFAINKMDTVSWSADRFKALREECASIVSDSMRFGIHPRWTAIPVSALLGDNLAGPSANMPWYKGPDLISWLDSISSNNEQSDKPFRFFVQYVIKPGIVRDRWQTSALANFEPERSVNYRAYAGRIMSGHIATGDDVLVLPSGRSSRVVSIQGASSALESAEAGMSISVCLADQIDVSRGDALVRPYSRPQCSDQFKARVVWMQSGALMPARSYIYRSVYGQALAEVTRVVDRVDTSNYLPLAAERLEMNEIGEVELAVSRPMPFDPYVENKWSGSFLLLDRQTNATAGCGMIVHGLRRAENVPWQLFSVNRESRARLMHQRPAVLWFTGLSGSGKSTIADLIEKQLYYRGKHTALLDGDNIRHGLCKDLGFTEQDRIENIRRVGEVAKLMTDAGLIVLACFISPYRSDRDFVRGLFGPTDFHEIFVDAPLEVCAARDPKGLYKKAREGKIPNFTGVNAPYEAPTSPEVHLDSSARTVDECVEEIMSYLAQVKLL